MSSKYRNGLSRHWLMVQERLRLDSLRVRRNSRKGEGSNDEVKAAVKKTKR